MATLIQSYEQQYSVLTADLTSRIGRLKSGNDEDRDELIKEIQASFEEANDLLEQLELEWRGAGGGARVPAYRAELQRLRTEFRAVSQPDTNVYLETEEGYEDWSSNEQQRRLLAAESGQRVAGRLREGYSLALEAEEAGTAALRDLGAQRETLQRARARLRETDGELWRSSRLVQSMLSRERRAPLVAALAVLTLLLCLGIYYFVT